MISTALEAPVTDPNQQRARPLVPAGVDALVVATWFAVSGALGALVWSRVVDLPVSTKVGEAAGQDPTELLKQVGVDGWFFVIAVVGGLLGGVLLMTWRRRDPLLMVLLLVLGGLLASWLMVRLGIVLGPPDPLLVLKDAAEGATAPTQLELRARGIFWVWSIAAAMGALIRLWVLDKPDAEPADSVA